MIDLRPVTNNEAIMQSDLNFMIPTKISNQNPIFLFSFDLNNTPSVSINLNPNLYINAKTNEKSVINTFNKKGRCIVSHQFAEEYFIDAELELQPDFSDSQSDNYCKMKINYGRGKSELYYLKGIFNLNDF